MHRAKPRLEPHIETERLLLRPIREADLDDLVAGVNDLRTSHACLRACRIPMAAPTPKEYLTLARRNADIGRSIYLVMERDGRLIGNIGIGAMPTICEFGYWLGRAHWGQGLATEAGRAVLGYGFDVLGIRLVRSGIFADNLASLRVQMKLGFRRVGSGPRHSLRGAPRSRISIRY